jgi:hypothetical protein
MSQLYPHQQFIFPEALQLAFGAVRQLEMLEHQFLHFLLVGSYTTAGSKHGVNNGRAQGKPE